MTDDGNGVIVFKIALMEVTTFVNKDFFVFFLLYRTRSRVVLGVW